MKTLLQYAILAALLYNVTEAEEPPRFVVPGYEREMETLGELHALHHGRRWPPRLDAAPGVR